MARPRVYRTSAVVLRRMNLGEADRIVTLYTAARGKLRAVVKGARRPTSRKAGHLEIFNHTECLLAEGRELDVISQAEVKESYPELRGDLERSAQAYAILELIDSGTPERLPQPDLFALLIESLRSVSREPNPALVALHAQIKILDQLGYRPELSRCLNCLESLEAVENYLVASLGGALCPSCGQHDPDAHLLPVPVLKLVRVLQRSDAQGTVRLKVPQAVVTRASQEIRALSEHALDRALRAPAFIARVHETFGTYQT